ncbi:MAG: HAMP domain-containing sensor histidine kinase [Bacteroidota bacterium]
MKRFIWYRNLSLLALVGLLSYWWTQRYELAEDSLRRELQLSVDEQLARRVLEIFRFDDAVVNEPESDDSRFQFGDSSDVSMQVVILGDTLAEQLIDTVRTTGGLKMSMTKVIQDSTFKEGILENWIQNHDRILNAHLDSLSTHLSIDIVRHDTAVPIRKRQFQLNLKQNQLSGDVIDIATVEHYHQHLLFSMWPEFLAGGFLLLLTSLAFWQSSKTMRSQQKLIEDRDELLANMAHELKTPIAGVSAALEALQHFDADADPDRFKDYIKLSRIEMDRLDKLADQSLLSLQLEAKADHTAPTLEATDLRKSLLKNWEPVRIRHQLQESQLKLPEAPWPGVRADDRYLSTILANLLSNAVKYGGEPLALSASVKASGDSVELRLSDQGPGINPDQANRIFERFYRIKDSEGHRVKGNGLGLSLSRQLARAMGGDLWLDKAYEDGAAFILKLPIDGRA